MITSVQAETGTCIYNSFIYNNPKLEVFNRWMVKYIMIHLYQGILLGNKKQWNVWPQHIGNLKGIMLWGKQTVDLKGSHSVWFHSYNVLNKISELENRWLAGRGWGLARTAMWECLGWGTGLPVNAAASYLEVHLWQSWAHTEHTCVTGGTWTSSYQYWLPGLDPALQTRKTAGGCEAPPRTLLYIFL